MYRHLAGDPATLDPIWLRLKGTVRSVTADTLEVTATATFDKVGDGFKITKMHLVVRAKVPNVDPAAFDKIAQATKDGCPVSQVLKGNLQMTLDAKLE